MTSLNKIPKRVLITRVAMCGGGMSYAVEVPVSDVLNYQSCRYTTIWRDLNVDGRKNHGEYIRLEDALTSEDHFAMPTGWERYEDRLAIDKATKPIAYELAVIAFPELAQIGKIPFLWATGLLPVETHRDVLLDTETKTIIKVWEWRDGKPYALKGENNVR